MTRHLARVLAAAVAVAVLALWFGTQPAQAQRYRGGYDPLSGWSWDEDFRYNPVTNPFGYRGSDWASPSRSYGSVGYYNPYSAMPSLGVPPPNYFYGYPVYSYVPPLGYTYGASAQPAATPDNAARVRVLVPAADAKVWFDGKETKQTGVVRRFESPALTPGHEYSYDVKAQWRDQEGKEVTRTRHVDVRANGLATVDFRKAE
jgi:uncharacterized protein (TIGR03000 family)